MAPWRGGTPTSTRSAAAGTWRTSRRWSPAARSWISDDNWGGDFHSHKVTKTGGGWPSGFIHFHDVALNNKKPRPCPARQGRPDPDGHAGHLVLHPDGYTYQWFADGQAIKDATAATLNLGPGKVGQQISVQVAASAQGYASAIATSAVTNEVAPGEITTVAEPLVSGEALVGSALTATRGSYDPGSTTKTVQWLSDGQPIAGATAWTLRAHPRPGRHGGAGRGVGGRDGYEPTTANSAPTPSVLGGTVKVTSPFTVSGAPRLGPARGRARCGRPSDATASTQRLRDGAPIPCATGATYVPVAADVGARLLVRKDLSRQGYKPTTATTDATTAVHTVPQLQCRRSASPAGPVTVTITAPGATGIRGDHHRPGRHQAARCGCTTASARSPSSTCAPAQGRCRGSTSARTSSTRALPRTWTSPLSRAQPDEVAAAPPSPRRHRRWRPLLRRWRRDRFGRPGALGDLLGALADLVRRQALVVDDLVGPVDGCEQGDECAGAIVGARRPRPAPG